ncbi:MAG: ABC transporter permease [Acidimicrobiia bacterium]|nr:ABC transporter permease [Acidimicrobiia bacterium]MYC57751.1 ABC transporter permease [Acidimicrobiia bacterium]MYG93434.1 ABC transporter permease [Acidimicrobiia bacterium]MYI31300.1 ABC transporter permease [Acidimicrobiia bacterium]
MTTFEQAASLARLHERVRLDRGTITGLLFGLLGVTLIAGVAPTIDSTTRQFNFERPPDPAGIRFHPPTWIITIGVLYLLTAALSLGSPAAQRWARLTRVLSALSFIPLTLVLSLALSDNAGTNVVNLLGQSLVLATPLALGATTGLWSERSGIINIGIEGTMLTSAGVGYMIYALLGNANSAFWLWFSIVIAILAGGLVAALHAVLSIRFEVNQIVSGVVINLFALGLTGFLRSEVIFKTGNTSGVSTSDIGLPLLSSIPVVGTQLFSGGPIYWMMYLVVFGTWLVMFRTPWGLRVRSCGENPHAAETLGINVLRIRYQSVILGGFIAGLGGAWFSMESQAGFDNNMTNAAGFIALAALIFGKWTPWGAFSGALLFGFSRALGTRLQFLGVEVSGFEIPSEFFQSLPFVVTLVVVAGAVGQSIPPAAAGQPFHRSK